MKKFLSFLLPLFTICALSAQTEKATVYFDYNKDALTPSSIETIRALLQKHSSASVTAVSLVGHTDSDGSDVANIDLSRRRVESVKAYLVSYRIPPEKISSAFVGERQPLSGEENEAGKQKNRCVEITITWQENAITQTGEQEQKTGTDDGSAKLAEASGEGNESSDYQWKKFGNDTSYAVQHFTINGKQGGEITGAQGTKIHFDGNSFVDSNGKDVSGNIDIVLIEAYEKSDMIGLGLTTTSNGKLLESGGMVFIGATFKGAKISFDSSWFYEISFPVTNKQNEMSIFYGDSASGGINWREAARSFRSDKTFEKNRDDLTRYVFNSSQLGWINCDHFVDCKKLTEVTVNLSDTDSISVMLVFSDIKSVMSYSGFKQKGVFFVNIPVGYSVTAIAFRRKNGKILYAEKPLVVQKNQEESLELQEISKAEFQQHIDAFH